MYLTERELEFDFSNVIQAFKFDEKNKASPHYHGADHYGMKAVDFIIERKDDWLFVEVKDYNLSNQSKPTNLSEQDNLTTLVKGLTGKYKDSFLYRWAEGKIDGKPIQYICLVELNNYALISTLTDRLKKDLPIGLPQPERWQNKLLQSVIVVNIEKWNTHFPECPVTRVLSGD